MKFFDNGASFKTSFNNDVDLTKDKILTVKKKCIKKLEPVSFWRQTGLVNTGDPKLIAGKEACKNFSDMVTCDRCGAPIPAYFRDTLCQKCLEDIEKFACGSSLEEIEKSRETVRRLEKDRVWFL